MKGLSYLLYLLILLAAGYFGTACANIGSPTGGAKDSLPPNSLAIDPLPRTLNYKEPLLQFTFDEPVALKDLQSQLIISPRTDIRYKTKVNKNVVEIRFEEPLEDSTTYTFNFRDAFVDITEGNPAKNMYLAFSTGPYLDSLSISGQVKDALTQKAADKATIALYSLRDTSNVLEDKPLYFTQTDASGAYQLQNLKQGKYLLYAFNDKNKNLILQTNAERYGYLTDTLNLTSSVDSVNLELFSANAEIPKILAARPVGKYYEVTFNKSMLDYQLAVEGNDSVASNFVENKKKIRIYPFALTDSVRAQLTAVDSLQQTVSQELFIKFEESSRAKAAFTTEVKPNAGTAIGVSPKITLMFTKPVAKVITDSIRFQYDSLTAEGITAAQLAWNERRDRVVITKTLTPPKPAEKSAGAAAEDAGALARGAAGTGTQTVKLVIPKGSFISVEADTADIQEVTYNITTDTQTGIINGIVQTNAENFIVQLVKSSDYQVVDELFNTKKYNFKLVQPGDYLIRIIKDRNANRRWDPGNIRTLQPAEEVIISPAPITIKANWEINNPDILVQ